MTLLPDALLSLVPSDESNGFTATVPDRLCVGRGEQTFLLGGILVASLVEAMERTCELPVIYASAQFIGAARAGRQLQFVPDVRDQGKSARQMSIDVLIDDRQLVHGFGACGQRELAHQHFTAAPSQPGPGDCSERSVARLLSSNVNNLFEFRLAAGELPDRTGWTGSGGQNLACWVRARDGSPIDQRLLCVIADYAALAIPGALGRPGSGTSLDNTIRFCAPPDCEWTLLCTQVTMVRDGIAQTASRLIAPQGDLLATASQSMVLRLWD